MKRVSKPLTLVLLGLGLILTTVIPELFSCHGALSLRFLPIEQARIQFAKVQADMAKQRALRPALESIPGASAWIKYYDNPVFKPGETAPGKKSRADCFTIGYYENKYWMWYVGTPEEPQCQIGLATSPDGVNWTRHPENPDPPSRASRNMGQLDPDLPAHPF